jgi:hypothetical protein
MRLYHKDNGFHFLGSTENLASYLEKGWTDAPKGFQKALKEEASTIADITISHGERVLAIPKKRGPKPKGNL